MNSILDWYIDWFYLRCLCLYNIGVHRINPLHVFIDKDPCTTTNTIPSEPLRRVVYKTLSGETPICDMYVIQKQGQWFRVSDDMVNNATDVNACGTKYGIWMKGILKRWKCVLSCESFLWNFNSYTFIFRHSPEFQWWYRWKEGMRSRKWHRLL